MKEASDLHVSRSVVQLPWITVKVACTSGVFWLVLGFFCFCLVWVWVFFFVQGWERGFSMGNKEKQFA